MLRKVLIVLVLACALGAFGYWYYMSYEPSRARFPVQGVDVSHHQGAIDWRALAGAGVDFAYIKATEGGDFSDSRFAENWQGARQAGIVPGAYHFFTFCRKPEEQAAHVIATVPKEGNSLPPAVDVEFGGNCDRTPSREEFAVAFSTFLRTVEAHFGRKMVIYATKDAYTKLIAGRFTDRPFWFRAIAAAPVLKDRKWTFWQYHNKGSRPGVDGPVDLNAFVGTRAEFDAFLRGE